MKYSLSWLIEKHRQNPNALKYVFFWGHTQKQEGVIDDACFSQWFPSPITIDEVVYKTAEHWMMAGKAKLFKDDDHLAQIIASDKPGTAKALGRKVRNFDQQRWSDEAFGIVMRGNMEKFSQHPKMKEHLLQTGDKIIVEASPMDRIWGIGMGKSHADIMNPEKWRGKNLLGFALMEARDSIRENEL